MTLDRKIWIRFYALVVGLFLLVVMGFSVVNANTQLNFLDVGQGDAILIQTPEHKNILIDAGPNTVVVDRLGEQLGFYDKTIDLFIITHPDRDHYAGVMDVLQKYEIKTVAITGINNPDRLYFDFLEQAKAQGAELIFLQNQQDLQIGSNLFLDVVYPFQNELLIGQSVKDKNNTSISLRLMRRSMNGWIALALLTGDAEAPQERELLLSGQDLKAEIFKLGHHGSRSSSTDSFLAAVDPKTVVVSAGRDNQFGHPHEEVMERVKNLTVRRTDWEGTVSFNF
jgi:competence protein ComEC